MDGYAVLSSLEVLKWCFPTLPHMSRTHGIDVKKVLVLVPVINMHPLLDIGDALYKSAGCMRGNTITKMGRI